ncbi:hypothetical protein ACFWUZ_28175 [Streptomyces sp. NPDC058646]|uniref:hypothetical protein n=1 Tax=Streptomyces sp. NPDC058646 TaxID=3346574 RepID=UPI00366440BC
MADERNRWLDEAAAERLLRGEPVEPVGPAADPQAQARAARLRAALDSLAEPPPAAAEFPGEAAAVAAFRAARGTAVLPADAPGTGTGHAEPLVDLGHLPLPASRGRRSSRPVRFGLAAALASVAVGGLAAAVGAGLLDGPRHDSAGPGPAMSVSIDGDPAPADSQDPTLGPNLRPTPLRDEAVPNLTGGPRTPGVDGATPPGTGTAAGASPGRPVTEGAGKDAQGGLGGGEGKDGDVKDDRTATGTGEPEREGFTTDKDRDGEREGRLRLDFCKDYRAGRITDDRRDRLARLAGGTARIPRFCESLLDGPRDGTREDAPGGTGSSGSDGSGGSGPKGAVLRAPLLSPAQPGGRAGLLGGL